MKKQESQLKRLLAIRGMGQVLTVSIGLILLCIVFTINSPTFFSTKNIPNLLRQIAPILIIGIGQSYVLITANIDLSIGSVVGMSCMVSATMMTRGSNPWIASFVTLLLCMVFGIANGLLVAKTKLPPFIATLGTMSVCRGIAQIVNNNYNTDAIGETAKQFRDLFYYGKFLGVYNAIWITIVLFLIFNFILAKTRTGRHIYAVGSNIEAAKLSGINTDLTTIYAYIISSFCACVVGLIVCASTGMGTMDAGTSYEMYAVAASVIGGVSTLGGQGLLVGTFVGAAIWGVLQNGLQFAGILVGWRNVVIGIIVIISVMLDVVLRKGKPRKKRKNLNTSDSANIKHNA